MQDTLSVASRVETSQPTENQVQLIHRAQTPICGCSTLAGWLMSNICTAMEIDFSLHTGSPAREACSKAAAHQPVTLVISGCAAACSATSRAISR